MRREIALGTGRSRNSGGKRKYVAKRCGWFQGACPDPRFDREMKDVSGAPQPKNMSRAFCALCDTTVLVRKNVCRLSDSPALFGDDKLMTCPILCIHRPSKAPFPAVRLIAIVAPSPSSVPAALWHLVRPIIITAGRPANVRTGLKTSVRACKRKRGCSPSASNNI